MKDQKNKKELRFPEKLLGPIRSFLEKELVKIKKQKKNIKADDPFLSPERTSENSLEEDIDEQIGHFDAEVKVNFLNKQMVQIRKSLTRLKIGKYGICEKCGKMIDTDRLSISPEVTTCVKCSKENE